MRFYSLLPDHYRMVFIYFLGAVFGSAIMYAGLAYLHPIRSFKGKTEQRMGQVSLINPLLDCGPPAAAAADSLSYVLYGFESALQAFVKQQLGLKRASEISVYFRDLNNGPIAGFNEDATFRPGSMLKIPLAIGYLKRAESDPTLLEKRITLSNPEALKLYEVQGVKPSIRLKLGESYTIEQLLKAALIKSDNVAASLLERFDQHLAMRETAIQLDIPVHDGEAPYRKITVREYAGFLRVLFNATYLSRENSEKILHWLELSEFKAGIAAEVPKGTRVANKFGESLAMTENETYFNDCGIIYYPQHPYLICVVARGSPQEELIKTIRNISAWTYDKVDQSFHN